ncbi:SGNH/GDSL hydrolase family protein [Calothrix sp. CCY 0018]|uniref:SGNH/GDSL hydrolase family protein n=1 Tax=Calothrix sp. CCY 0018 TaxID=3103864 RepID=UPI0039C6B4DB
MTSNKLFILLTSLLLLILGSSIALNILLYNQAKKYYLQVNETRLDPSGLSHYPVNLKKTTDKDKIRVIFFGDSRAEGWISPKIGGYEFINRGIHAQTSVQTVQRFEYHINSLQPNIVIIQVGVNDLKTIALFPERKDSIIANCRNNIKRIVDESKSLGAVVILTTIFPVGEVPIQRKPFWSDDIESAVNEVNTYIATLAEDKVVIFDAFSILADNQGMMLQEYASDELHLNDQGYEILNKELVQRLDKIKT